MTIIAGWLVVILSINYIKYILYQYVFINVFICIYVNNRGIKNHVRKREKGRSFVGSNSFEQNQCANEFAPTTLLLLGWCLIQHLTGYLYRRICNALIRL